MMIHPDTTGFQLDGDAVWADPETGDRMSVHSFDLVPSLPAGLDDVARLRYELTAQTAEVGGLIEAFVVTVHGSPALLQVVKLPLPDRRGQAFIASITVPKATSSAVLKLVAVEGPTTGLRESAVLADVIGETGNPDAYFGEHPYAPRVLSKLPWHRADDPQYDQRFPGHPLSRARQWLRRMLETARLDPAFAAQPPFGSPVSVSIGLPIGPFLPLWTVDERMTFYRMRDADVARAQLGRGGADRRGITQTESCEAAWLYPADGVLVLSQNQPPVQLTSVSDETAYTSITMEEIVAAFDWIGELSVAAAERAEMLLVRTGSTADGANNYVLMSLQVTNGDRSNPSCVVETSPVPVGAEFWDTLPPLPDPAKAGFARPRDADQARTDGRLTMWAVRTWDVHPFRLMLTYKANPDLA